MAKKATDTEDKKESQSRKFDKVHGVIGDLNKRYNKKIIRTGDAIPTIKKVPFKEPTLDFVSDGGVPIGRMTEALGAEHSGKTRNALKSMSEFQKYCFNCFTSRSLSAEWKLDKKGNPYPTKVKCSNCTDPETKINVIIDIEGTIDPDFMENFGIDVNGVVYSRIDVPSQAIDIVDAYLRIPEIGLILVDSVGAMGSDSEVEKSMEDIKMNQNALFLNRGMRKWQAAMNSNTNETGKENGVTMIIINQSYQTLSIYSTEVAQGGRGLRHGKGMSLKTRIREKVMDKDRNNVLGLHIVYENMKNKTGMPYRRREYYLNLDKLDPMGYCQTNIDLQYVEFAIEFGIIEQKGAWFYYEGQSYQGKANLIDGFNEDMKNAVDAIIYKK